MKGQSPAVALIADASAPVPFRAIPLSRLRDSSATQIGYTTAALLAVGLLISIATTPDPLWWQLHFSRLGTFAAFSGHMFNATIVLTGVGVVVFAMGLRREMRRHAGTQVLANRRAATVVPLLVAVLGIHLSFVGIIPVSTNEFLHDRASTGAVLAFVVILASSRWMLRGMHRVIGRASRGVGLGLAVTVAPYIAGFINLAAFELIVFVQVFSWLLLFARTIGRPAEEHVHPAAAAERTGSMHRTVVVAPGRHCGRTTVPAGPPARQPRRAGSRRRLAAPPQRRMLRMRVARQSRPEHTVISRALT